MINGKRVIVVVTYGKGELKLCTKDIFSILNNTCKPDLVYINLSSKDFPNRFTNIQKDILLQSMTNPIVKISFGFDLDYLFKNDIVIKIKRTKKDEIDSDFIKCNLSHFGNNTYDVILSLTSFPSRLKRPDLLLKCLDSLVNQKTKYKYHIIITLFKDDIRFVSSQMLQYCLDNDIEILPCHEDLKGNKKFFYVMQKHYTLPIIVVDDDLIFYDNLIESLMDKYAKNPNVIWTGWCQKMNLGIDDKLIYSERLEHNSISEVPSFKYKFGSGSGTLIPPFLVQDFNSTLNLIKEGDNVFHDELVLKKLSLDVGVKVGLCKNTKYKCDVGGWLTHTQFIENEIQPQVESPGNLHSINCSTVNVNGKIMYRGMLTEMNLLGKYTILDNKVCIN